jgi:4-amino-4-deoxy-L-arabinose transferase-like glycosyltransferase
VRFSHGRKILVGVLLLAALGLRVGEVLRTSDYRPVNDARAYLRLARQIDHSGDYASKQADAGGADGPTAYFPPAYPYLLAAVNAVDGHSGGGAGAVTPARISQALLGTVTVALVGLVALEASAKASG